MAIQIKKATRKEVRLRAAIEGPTKAGKTYTGIRLLCALAPEGKRIVIDSEHGRACLYAGRPNPDGGTFEFDTIELDGNYSVEAYMEALAAAQEAGYEACLVDSLSHAWSGKGGILDTVQNAQKYGSKNSFQVWGDATPKHQMLTEAILGSKMHIISTMRSKMEYVLEKNEETGKSEVRKVGLKAVQREDVQYEYDLVLTMDENHYGRISGTRFEEIDANVIHKPGADLAKKLLQLIKDGSISISDQEQRALEEKLRLEREAAEAAVAAEQANIERQKRELTDTLEAIERNKAIIAPTKPVAWAATVDKFVQENRDNPQALRGALKKLLTTASTLVQLPEMPTEV